MKKTTKGAIAAGSATLLLAGGMGTMAAWNASTETSGGGTVNAGNMSIAEQGDGSWTWADGTAFDPETDLLVPGDSVTYTATYTYTLNGTNLEAELSADLDGVSGDLATYLTVESDADDVTITESGQSEFSTTITFDPTDVSTNEGMDADANLAGGTVVLEQVIN